jgi:hypothetical protein
MSVANQSTNGSKIILKTADALGAGTIYAGYGGKMFRERCGRIP